MALTNFKFLGLGIPGAGKTELGLRLISVLGTSGSSTLHSNVFSALLKNPLIESGEFFISKNKCIGQLWDYAGQRINIEEIGPELEDCNGGIIYVCDSTKNDLQRILELDRSITQEYNRINLEKPICCVYVSKCMLNESVVKLDDVISNDYKTINNYIQLADSINSLLILADSVGENINEPKPYVYLINSLVKKNEKSGFKTKMLENPVEVDVTAPMTLSILLKRAYDRRLSRSLEKPVIDELKEHGVI